jgi:O-antigen/teichoic acid export membrane protein
MLQRTIARNSFFITIDTVVSFVSSLLVSILAARVLGPDNLGYFNYLMWISNMAALFVSFGVPAATNKYAADLLGRDQPGAALGLIRATVRYQAGMGLLMSVGGTLIVLALLDSRHWTYSILVMASLAPQAMMGLYSAANDATEQTIYNVVPSMLSAVLQTSATLAALLGGFGLTGLAAATLIGRTADAVFRYLSHRRLYGRLFPGVAPEPVSPELRGKLVTFCGHASVLWLLQAVVWDRSDVVFLERFCAISQVTFFTVPFNLMNTVLLLPRIFTSAAGISMTVQQGRDPAAVGGTLAKVLRYLTLAAAPMVAGVAALSVPIIKIYGPKYDPAAPVLLVVAIFGLWKVLMVPVQRVLVVTENQRILIAVGIVCGVLNVALDLWWVPRWGAMGAAFGSGIAQAIAAIAVIAIVVRRMRVPLPYATLAKTVASAIAMGLVVGAIGRALPTAAALAIGIPAGVVVYAAALRLSGALDAGDAAMLHRLAGQLPAVVRPWVARGVRLMVRG